MQKVNVDEEKGAQINKHTKGPSKVELEWNSVQVQSQNHSLMTYLCQNW